MVVNLLCTADDSLIGIGEVTKLKECIRVLAVFVVVNVYSILYIYMWFNNTFSGLDYVTACER